MKTYRQLGNTLVLLAITTSSASHGALFGRDIDGDLSTAEAFYDDVLNITWLRDANFAQTSGFDSDGLFLYNDATAWAASLSIGIATDWRLPSIRAIDPNDHDPTLTFNGSTDRGYLITRSEMGHMYYNNLGNLAYRDENQNIQPGYGLNNIDFIEAITGQELSFDNLFATQYWSQEEFTDLTSQAWTFNNDLGLQFNDNKSELHYAWAVHDGDVLPAIIPVPTAAWLFGSALIGLAGISRKR